LQELRLVKACGAFITMCHGCHRHVLRWCELSCETFPSFFLSEKIGTYFWFPHFCSHKNIGLDTNCINCRAIQEPNKGHLTFRSEEPWLCW
jgi:hypothetical protein